VIQLEAAEPGVVEAEPDRSCLYHDRFPAHDDRLLIYELRRPRVDPRRYSRNESVLQQVFVGMLHRDEARRLCWREGWVQLPDEQAPPAATAGVQAIAAYFFSADAPAAFNEDIIEAIAALPEPVQVALLLHLTEQNMLLSETSPILAAAAGCSTNAQLLISREEAVQAIWYIIDYMTKERYDLTTLRPIVLAAIRHVNRFPSEASDKDDPAARRRARQFLQRIVNSVGHYTQISIDMAAAHVLGEPAHSSTDPQAWVFWKSAIAYRMKLARSDADPSVLAEIARFVDEDDTVRW